MAGKPGQIRDLVDWVRDYMDRNEMADIEVAKRAGYVSNSGVSTVLRRERDLPLAKVNDWIKALRLRDREEVEYFKLLVDLSHSPRRLREAYWRLVDQMEAMERKAAADSVAVLRRLEAIERMVPVPKAPAEPVAEPLDLLAEQDADPADASAPAADRRPQPSGDRGA